MVKLYTDAFEIKKTLLKKNKRPKLITKKKFVKNKGLLRVTMRLLQNEKLVWKNIGDANLLLIFFPMSCPKKPF